MSVEDFKPYVDLCLEGRSTMQERYEIIMKQQEIALAWNTLTPSFHIMRVSEAAEIRRERG